MCASVGLHTGNFLEFSCVSFIVTEASTLTSMCVCVCACVWVCVCLRANKRARFSLWDERDARIRGSEKREGRERMGERGEEVRRQGEMRLSHSGSVGVCLSSPLSHKQQSGSESPPPSPPSCTIHFLNAHYL